MEDTEVGLGQYLALQPGWIGEEPTDLDMKVAAFDDHGRTVAHAAAFWDLTAKDDDLTDTISRHVQDILPREIEVARLLVIGYGPSGPYRAEALAATLHQRFDIEPARVQVADGFWRTPPVPGGAWMPARSLPPAPPQLDLANVTVSATVLDGLTEAVTPLDAPLFDPLDPVGAMKLLRSSPVQRAAVARQAQYHLSEGPLDDPALMQVLAHLISSDVVIRDVAVGYAVSSDERQWHVDALVRTFRAAPAELRPALASPAATGVYFAGWQRQLVHRLLDHAAPLDPLAVMLSRALVDGINPYPLREALETTAERALHRTQATWSVRHSRRTQRGHGDSPPSTHQGPRPRGPLGPDLSTPPAPEPDRPAR